MPQLSLSKLKLHQLRNYVRSPLVDIIFLDYLPHFLHPPLPFCLWHLQRLLDGIGEMVGIMGIYEQGISQLSGSPREGAQYEHTVLIEAASDKFLGYQIHTIMQRADYEEIGHAA
jgi:hypothetical protein